MKAITDVLLEFELESEDQPDALGCYLERLKDRSVHLSLELCQGLIAIDAERKLRSAALPNLPYYLTLFPAIEAQLIEPVLLETMQQFTSTFCPVRAVAGKLPCEINGVRFNREIGRGATAVVYEAERICIGRPLAAKVLFLRPQGGEESGPTNAANPTVANVIEACMLAKIEHECIPTVYDVIELQGRPCILMKMINGLPLRKYCDKQALVSIPHAVKWMVQLAQAIHECHLHGMLHRDLKPENILNCEGKPVIVDFGLASDPGQSTAPLAGSPGYLAPELLRDSFEPLMAACDVFALGVIFYELLVGSHPYPQEDFSQPPRRLTDLRPDIDAELESICLRAIAVEPQQRYHSAQSFYQALQIWQQHQESSPKRTHPILNWIAGRAAAFLA